MNQIMIWKDIDKLDVTYQPGSIIPDDFIKLSCSNENVFLLAKDHSVWFGKVDSNMGIMLKQVDVQAVDIACSGYYLYYTNKSGQVFKAFIDNLELQDEVILHEDAKSCVHGYITASQHISVKHIEAGGMGILFLSESGQLWASGDHPQLDIHNEDGPKKVTFFEGRHVISLACGKDFNCVVVHRRDDHCPLVNGDLANDDNEVFVSTCPQCANENIISPLSPQSECPLDLKKHSNESISVSTSTSKNIDSEDKKSDNENSSSSTEGDSVHRPKNDNAPIKNLDNDTDSDIAEEEKGDRMSRLLMNTEAARQFFTRQLSWMSSGGEEFLAEVSGNTKIIKKNVTTMASLVYEGVKTVGDKVATLSRHVSGGSDDNNSDSFEEFVTDLNPSSTSSVRCEWSCSGAYSDVSDRGADEKLALYLNRGSRLIKTEVWTWGNIHHGQLGTGDTVSRNKPVVVYQLTHVGTMRVECGWSHCAAVTLTGRCAVWGRNDMGQVCEDTKGTDQSSPIIWGRTSQAVTGSRHTLLLAPDNTLHWLGKHRPETLNSNNTELDISDYITNEGSIPLRVLSSSDYSVCLLGITCTEMTCNSDLANEQCFLEEMINVHTSVVKPLSRKSCLDDFVSNLCSRYTDLIHFTALNVATLYQGLPSCLMLQTHTDEHLLVYERYLTAVCDVTAMNGFAQIARSVDIPQKLISCFADRLPSRKTSPENVLTFAFVYPLSRISFYKMMLSRGSNEVTPEFQRWESFCETQEISRKQAEATRVFWENSGRLVDTLRIPQRRLIRDSKSYPLTIHNASRFSNHWLILLSDSFVHVSGANQNIHSLDTLWVEPLQDCDTLQNALVITTPEDSLTLIAPSACDKMDWLHAFQDAIKKRLNRNSVPTTRIASYTFTKHATYKDAKYTGRWMSGKLEGKGRLEWPDGKFYIGHFHCSQPQGVGRLEIPGVSIYEGFWKDGLQNGHGSTKYENGDVYEGYFKDGLPCGHGVHKSGHFMTNSAYTYFGEWVAGQKQGYGVMDEITTGEKYMGCWNNNMKSGNGVIITRDGIYYEGMFSQNDINGQALMVFEDGSYYEGEMRTAGVFNGKGTFVFASGDRVEGSMYGPWTEGIKITTGTLHKLPSAQTVTSPKREKPKMFGKLSTPPNQKWKAIFRQCWITLGASPDGRVSERERQRESARAWENIAAVLSSQYASNHRHNEKLLTIPDFSRENLDSESYKNICNYLSQAFGSSYHPLGITLSELTKAYNNTYGVVCDHSYLLLQHAVEELHSITERLYQIIRLLFPALPVPGEEVILGDKPSDVASMVTLLHPEILPRICSELFDLYTLDNKQENDAFRKRLLELNQHSDSTLMAFLDIDKKLWMNNNGELRKEKPFCAAIETLQLLKTTFVPLEKFMILQKTFKRMEDEVNERLDEEYLWTTDRIIPLLEFVIIRSQILHLASEVRFMADFMEERFKHGEFDFYFTNLNACYEHILEEKKTTIFR